MNMQPLNDKERRFAEKNHDLVYAFLHEKNLPETLFYDVVVFGYLNAVQQYCKHNTLHRYRFSTLAWKQMNRSLSNYYKYLSCSKRNIQTVSLNDLVDGNDILRWIDIISYPNEVMLDLETDLLLHGLAAKLPVREMRIIRMKVCGFKTDEIAKHESVSPRTIRRWIDGTRNTVMDVLFG